MRPAALALCLAALAGGGAGVGAGCAARGAARATEPAAHGVEAYLAALRADDPHRAYALLSEGVRKEVSYDRFAEEWKGHANERAHQSQALGADLAGDADLGERAKIVFPDGKTLSLHRQSGTWRLEAPLLVRTHAATPHIAVEVFAEALAARDYQGVMHILTARRRRGIGRQVDAFVKSLNQHLEDQRTRISLVGKDRAELVWDDGAMRYKVILRLEGDEWRVDDIDARPAPQDQDHEGTGSGATGGHGDEHPRSGGGAGRH